MERDCSYVCDELVIEQCCMRHAGGEESDGERAKQGETDDDDSNAFNDVNRRARNGIWGGEG